MKIQNLIRRIRFAEERVYIFCELKKREKARSAMRSYVMIVAIQVALCILLMQGIIIGILWLY